MERHTTPTSEQAIEAAAERLLRAYEADSGVVLQPPIPIAAIVDPYLGLRVVAADLPPGVLGALRVETREVFVAKSLVAKRGGRYCFTLAHEVGHWELHAFQHTGAATTYCSDRQADVKEREANLFAACLLMPRGMIHQEWQQHHVRVAEGAKRAMARQFAVSNAAMALRLAALDILPGRWRTRDQWPFTRRI